MEEEIFLSLAGFNIKFTFKKTERDWLKTTFTNQVKIHYKDFVVPIGNKRVDFFLTFIFTRNISSLFGTGSEKNYISLFRRISNKRIESYYHLSLHQLDLLVRQILQELLSKNNGFVIHASAINVNNTAFLFLGKSGAGKSTSVDLLRKNYQVLSDDLGLVKKEGRNFYYYQQYSQEKLWTLKKSPKKYLIQKVFFLKKSKQYLAKQLSNKSLVLERAIPQLFSQGSDLNLQIKTVMEFVAENNFFYQLSFAKDETKMLELFKSEELSGKETNKLQD